MEKGTYILICYKDGGDNTPIVVFPHKEVPPYGSSIVHTKDYKEAEEFIKDKLGLKFSRIIVVKVVEDLEPTLVNKSPKNYETKFGGVVIGC
jgi:hypothetical protein